MKTRIIWYAGESNIIARVPVFIKESGSKIQAYWTDLWEARL